MNCKKLMFAHRWKLSLQSGLDMLALISRSPAFFALLLQGIGGLIQVTAFLVLNSDAYLDFSKSFLYGTLLSIFLVLNFENIILGGKFSPSINRYFLFFWVLGLAALVGGKAAGVTSPNYIAFCCWGVCSRILLAWSASQPAVFLRLFVAGLLVAATCLSANLNYVMIVSMLAMAVSAPAILRVGKRADAGMRVEIWRSASSFIRYLPHTASGLLLGYFDRYMALNVVGGPSAELYLRTLQICSWAAFVCYPAVFIYRNRILAHSKLPARSSLTILLVLAGMMAVSVLVILLVLHYFARAPVVSPELMGFCLVAIVLSQFYQVISILNFVGERFSSINRITLFSGCVSLAVGVFVVRNYPSAPMLALMLLAGWLTQVSLTLHSLRRKD